MIGNKDLELVISHDQIQARVQEVANEINRYYRGEELVAVCVLKGAFVFFGDLVKNINLPIETDFVQLSSYADGSESKGVVSFKKGLDCDITNKHVLIVEDIIDTGLTMSALKDYLSKKSPRSIKIASFINKLERRQHYVEPNFNCFCVGGYLVGYGLDYAEKYRNLSSLYKLNFTH